MPYANVLHLETGQVLAAVSSGKSEPTIAQLTGGKPLRVRLWGSGGIPGGPGLYVDVPVELLRLKRLDVDDDVLDRPYYYRVTTTDPPETPPLMSGPSPATNVTTPTGPPNAACVVVWQIDEQPEVARPQLNGTGKFNTNKPTGTDCALVAWATGPLILDTSPP